MYNLVTDCHSNLAKWSCRLSQLFNTYGVTQTEKHTAESLVPESTTFEVEMAIEKLKSHK